MKSSRWFAVVALLFILFATKNTIATPISSSSASAVLTITAIRNLDQGGIEALSIEDDPYADAFTYSSPGNIGQSTADASANPSTPGEIFIGDEISLEASSSATAIPEDPLGWTFPISDGLHEILIRNSSEDTFEVDLLFEYAVAVDASVTDEMLEWANAEAWSSLYDLDTEFFIGHLQADTRDGLADLPISGSLSLSLVIEEDRYLWTEVYAAAYADIAAPIPEPSSLLLLGTGLLSVAGIARRRKS